MLVKQSLALRQKAETVLEIMWITINDHFDLWGKPMKGIHKGWKVSFRETLTGVSPGDFLQAVFGIPNK